MERGDESLWGSGDATGEGRGERGYVHECGGDCIRPFGKREIRFSDP